MDNYNLPKIFMDIHILALLSFYQSHKL